jgi:hypothetical protein
MSAVTIEEAQVKLPEIIDKLAPITGLWPRWSANNEQSASHASREAPRANWSSTPTPMSI